jgi:hypothetical protein
MSLTKFSMQPTLHFRNLLCDAHDAIIIVIFWQTLQIYYKLCKMYTYSNDEKTDMILVSEECLKDASLAARVACRSVTPAMLM